MRRASGYLVGWLALAALVQAVVVVLARRHFVYTRDGQLLDTIALAGNTIGQSRVEGLVSTVLDTMSVVSLAVAIIVIGFIALIRGRVVLAAVATLLVVGANLTTQLLKHVTERPDLGVDLARAAAGNSLPSGHTTVAASVAVALVLVLPPQVRGAAGLLGAGYAALAGVATLSAGWHRPSDAVAALLIVGVWAAVAGLVLVAARRRDEVGGTEDAHPVATTALALVGCLLLLIGALGLGITDQVLPAGPEQLSRSRLLVAYAGSAAGISGTASLVLAAVLATVHRVVPRRGSTGTGPAAQPRRTHGGGRGG